MIKTYFAQYKAYPFESIEAIKEMVDFVKFKKYVLIMKIKDEAFDDGWNDGEYKYLFITKESVYDDSILRDKDGVVCKFRDNQKMEDFVSENLDFIEIYTANITE